jgi:hypothetical protein
MQTHQIKQRQSGFAPPGEEGQTNNRNQNTNARKGTENENTTKEFNERALEAYPGNWLTP